MFSATTYMFFATTYIFRLQEPACRILQQPTKCRCNNLQNYFATICILDLQKTMMVQGIWVVSCLFDINWFFFGIEQFRITVTRNLIIKVLTVLAIVFTIRKPDDLITYVFIMAGSTALSQIVIWSQLRKFIKFEKVSFTDSKKHIWPIVRLFIPMLAVSIYHYMDKTMLDILSCEEEVGYYYSADKIVNIPLGVITAVGTVMLPRVTNVLSNISLNEAEKLIDKSTELVFFLASAIAFGLGAVAKEFVPIFFGDGYEPVIFLIQIFVPILIIKSLSDVVRTQYLIPAEKDWQYTIAVTSGAVINIIINLLCIPSLGAIGAVLGTFVAELTVLIVAVFYTSVDIKFLKLFLKYKVYIFLGIVMYGFVRIVSNILYSVATFPRLLVMISSGGMVYLLLCIIIWKVNKKSVFSAAIRKVNSTEKNISSS